MAREKRKRPGRGAGAVEQLPSGSWRAVVSSIDPRTGKRVRQSKTDPDKAVVVRWAASHAGFHRAEVYRLEEVAEVEVELREGGKEEAKLNALGSNKNHGLRRSNADKRRAVETALSMRPKWSDRKIADHCGVHHQMVADARSQLDDSSSSQPQQAGRPGRHARPVVHRVA